MKRNAFTLVELLVVIAIIGILVGLLLPAVQAAREAARRMSCSNNMVQISLSVHHHEFNMEHLPDGVTNETGPIQNEVSAEQHTGWMARILPYIEQQRAFELLDFDESVYSVANAEVRAYEIATFRCPSNPTVFGRQGSTIVGTSDYAGCYHDVETPIDDENHGLFFRNSAVRFADVTDGTTQTIMLGETLGDIDALGWISGTRGTLRNTDTFEDMTLETLMQLKRPALEVGGFGSFHSGGGNFALADGSVTFMTHRVDPEIFRAFGHRSDGKLMNEQDMYR